MANEIISASEFNINDFHCPDINVVIRIRMKLVKLGKFLKAVSYVNVRNYL